MVEGGGRKRKRMYHQFEEGTSASANPEKEVPPVQKKKQEKSKESVKASAKKTQQKKGEDFTQKSDDKKSADTSFKQENVKESVKEIEEDQMVIELVEELKYRGSVLSVEKQKELNGVLKKNMVWSMGLSVVPVPILDSFLVSTVQLKMIRDISNVYEIPFYRDAVKAYLSSVLGMVGYDLSNQILKSFLKKIPVIGAANMIASPIVAAGVTYALAKVFIYHYELGGNLLDFKPEKMRSYFSKQFKEGKAKFYRTHKATV